MKRMITIVELPPFLAQIGSSIKSEEGDDLINFLARNPEEGDEITGTGGMRKMRWGGKVKGNEVA